MLPLLHPQVLGHGGHWAAPTPLSPLHSVAGHAGKAPGHPPAESASAGTFGANPSGSRSPRKMWSRFCIAQHEP